MNLTIWLDFYKIYINLLVISLFFYQFFLKKNSLRGGEGHLFFIKAKAFNFELKKKHIQNGIVLVILTTAITEL